MGMFTSARVQHALLKGWHAWLAGSFLVAYVTADENTYAMHQFAGYAVLVAIVARLAGGLLAPAGSPLRLPRVDLKATRAWLSSRKGRHPLFAWFAAALLAVVGLAALSGAVADGAAWMEHLHEAISEASLWVIFGHIAFVTWMYAGKKWVGRIASWLTGIRLSRLPKENAR
ncbi:MAG: cytochrome b/b6 domain-containing protein [Hyphomicrobium sp.]|nr:cytochrome b/b6 domain-containing protein [Hyphomicrobium sp.]